jgi:FLVCR family MFS transporter 7
MGENKAKVYGYRWIVLLAFVLINMAVQIQWLTFAPIASEAALFYSATSLQIDFFSMLYLVVFLVVCVPAFYVIDTYGIRIGIGIGAVLTGLFGILKGIYAHDYTMVAISQTGLAIAQPFILNSATKVASHWFPVNERATAVGIATLAQFIGIVIVMVATPLMLTKSAAGTYDISSVLMTYGIISAVCAVLLLLLIREKPPTPPVLGEKEEHFAVFKGIKHIFSKKDAAILVVVFFIGLGAFNAISTCIDQICQVKNFSMEETGLIGGIMLIAGIIGAATVPVFSDKSGKRKPFLILGAAGTAVGMIILTFAGSFIFALTGSFILGFFLLGICAPIGFQYGAEVSYPAPESTAQGLVLLSGQVSGILFILGINKIGVSVFMYLFIVLLVGNLILINFVQESPAVSKKLEN